MPTDLGIVWGTWTHPVETTTTPAALIIGGSGPTDRDGNQRGADGVDTLAAVANWLAADGVATLRTDKPGSGKTGPGNLTAASARSVTVDDYLTMNAQLLGFVAARPGVAMDRIGVVGHSEGGLFALLLASGQHGAVTEVPAVHAIAGLEPQSSPILDILTTQLTAQIEQARSAGSLSADQATALHQEVSAAIAAIRAGQPLPTGLPSQLAGAFPPTALTYLRTADALDPRIIATHLPVGLPVLMSCSDADIQIGCDEVQQVADAAGAAGAVVTLTQLADVAHTLKVDPSRSIARLRRRCRVLPRAPASARHLGDQRVALGRTTGRSCRRPDPRSFM